MKGFLSGSGLYEHQRTLLILVISFITFVISYETNDKFHHAVLDRDNRFHLYWKIDDTKTDFVVFRVEVQTCGYVALGISPHGGMSGSDIVVGWMKDGKPFLQDRHAHSNEMPILDEQQDWELISGYENGTHTILQFRRKMDTYDEDDFPINNNTARIIYAYHLNDPKSEDLLPYHTRSQRGSKSIILLQPMVRPEKLPDDVKVWDVRLPNITIPDDVDTTYWCKMMKAPILNRKHHVIQIAPLVSAESAPYVHHMVLYRCLGGTARELEPYVHYPGHPCYVLGMPVTYTKCESVYAAWGVGAMDMVMPENAGLPLGDRSNLYFRLEIHYDNAEFHSGIVDQSGFRVYYRPILRRYDAMSLMVGAAVDPCIVIPPRRKKFIVAGHADPRCLGPAIPQEGIKIFAVFLHSHLLGRQMKLRHFRNNVELPFIVVDENYDFNYQEYRYLSEEVTVKPGDQLTVECSYDSTGRNRTTFGGLGTGEEMCLAFILYYPRIARARALSSANCDLVKSLAGMEIKEINGDEDANYTFYQHFEKNKPWDSNFIEIAESAMRFGYHKSQCFLGNGTLLQMPSYITYPKDLRYNKDLMGCLHQNFVGQLWADNGCLSIFSTELVWQVISFLCVFGMHTVINICL